MAKCEGTFLGASSRLEMGQTGIRSEWSSPAAFQGQDLFLFELHLKSLSVIHLVSHSFITVITIVSKQKDSGTKICKGIFRCQESIIKPIYRLQKKQILRELLLKPIAIRLSWNNLTIWNRQMILLMGDDLVSYLWFWHLRRNNSLHLF